MSFLEIFWSSIKKNFLMLIWKWMTTHFIKSLILVLPRYHICCYFHISYHSSKVKPQVLMKCLVVQTLSHVWLFVTQWTAAKRFPCPSLSPEFAQTHVYWVSDAIQLSDLLSSPFPPFLNLSQHQGLFQWVGLPLRWPKYWSFTFSLSPANDYSGLISFRINWFDLFVVQGTFKSLF